MFALFQQDPQIALSAYFRFAAPPFLIAEDGPDAALLLRQVSSGQLRVSVQLGAITTHICAVFSSFGGFAVAGFDVWNHPTMKFIKKPEMASRAKLGSLEMLRWYHAQPSAIWCM